MPEKHRLSTTSFPPQAFTALRSQTLSQPAVRITKEELLIFANRLCFQ